MKRVATGVITLMVVLTVVPALSAPAAADAVNNTTNNTTVQELRERLQQKNQTISDLRVEVDNLEDKRRELNRGEKKLNNINGVPKSTLENIRGQETLRAKVIKLQAHLEKDPGRFSESQKDSLKDIGCWNKTANEPAMMVWTGDALLACDPIHGTRGLEGQYNVVWEGDVRVGGWINFTLPYAPEGVDKQQNIKNGLRSSASTKVIHLINEFNNPKTKAALDEYLIREGNSAQTAKGQSRAFTGLGGFIGGLGAMYGVFALGIHQRIRDKRDKNNRVGWLVPSGNRTQTRIQQIGGLVYRIPVVGRIIQMLVEGVRERLL